MAELRQFCKEKWAKILLQQCESQLIVYCQFLETLDSSSYC